MLFFVTLFCCLAVTVSSQVVTECVTNADCISQLACIDKQCTDPCTAYCISGLKCNVQNHTAICGTQVNAPEQTGCVTNSDCTSQLACFEKQCSDPCSAYCFSKAGCHVEDHVAVCESNGNIPVKEHIIHHFSTEPPPKNIFPSVIQDFLPPFFDNESSTVPPRNKTPLVATTEASQQDSVTETKVKVTSQCPESKTRIKGRQVVCKGALLFEDHFKTGQLNASKWTREQYVAEGPDHEFVTYEKRAQNCFTRNGVLYLMATLREDPTVSQIDLSNGCTGMLCSVSVSPKQTLLPPIVAAKIKSKFSFLYGKVEIRAQLPKGDWIIPQVNLDPPGQFSYDQGRLWVAYARGNQDLRRHETEEQIGNSVLYAGGVLGQGEPLRTHAALRVAGEGGWGDAFHVYTMVWAPDGIQILVDGDEKGYISSPYTDSPDGAPFNKEFVISLGVAAGGFSDFPEGSTSNGNRMSWKKLSVRPMANFYRSKDQWYPTWAGDISALKIDYVKVWAL